MGSMLPSAAVLQKPSPDASACVMPVALSEQKLLSQTTHWLTQGGDTRIELSSSGTNMYGCAPRPDPQLVQLGSSTVSVISEAGFDAASAVYRRLSSPGKHHRLEVERQRQDLAALCGTDRLPGTELVFAASGTDIHLFAAHLAGRGNRGALRAVMAQASETGSGVPAALAALHFSNRTSQGQVVSADAPVAGTPWAQPFEVALRQTDGALRPLADVDAEFAAHVDDVLRGGGRCLLVLTDLSKTGLLAPSPACARQLQQSYGERLTVLVDACQFRLSADTLQHYLAQDFLVAITGSKFVGGPAFCGALLLPPAQAAQSRLVPLNALQDYSSRFDWPEDWLPASVLREQPNPGLVLRWEAALTELRRFRAIADRDIHDFLATWQLAVASRISSDDRFEGLPVPPLQRRSSGGRQAWDEVQTIVPFLVCKRTDQAHRRILSREETALLYRQLRSALVTDGNVLAQMSDMSPRFQLGQPVMCGDRHGQAVSALRMCSGARLVTEALFANKSVQYTIAETMLAFDKVAALAQRFA